MEKHIDSIAVRELFPGIKAQFFHTSNNTIGFVNLAKGAVLPEHAHMHEQTTQIMEGELEITINGTTNIYTKGMVVTIPSNVVHSAVAKTNCKVTDVFYPVREDYK